MLRDLIDKHYGEATKNGLEEGIKKGKEAGCQEQREKIARKLLEKNTSVEKISELTQLSIDFISAMPKEANGLMKLMQRNYDETFREALEIGQKKGFYQGVKDEENRIKIELKDNGFSDEDIADITKYSMDDALFMLEN